MERGDGDGGGVEDSYADCGGIRGIPPVPVLLIIIVTPLVTTTLRQRKERIRTLYFWTEARG